MDEKLEQSLAVVAKAFSDSPEGGAFFLKHMLLPDEEKNNAIIAFLYSEIRTAFGDEQKQLVESAIEALIYIRSAVLNNKDAFTYIEQQIEFIIRYRAMLDYVRDIPKEDFLKD